MSTSKSPKSKTSATPAVPQELLDHVMTHYKSPADLIAMIAATCAMVTR